MENFKKMKNKIIIIATILLAGLFTNMELYAHNKTIRGRVMMDGNRNEPIIGATVRITNSVLGSITNRNGRFEIKGVPDGTHEIVITSVGMKPIVYIVELEHVDGDEVELDLEMVEDPIRTKHIVITATRVEKIYEDVPVKMSVLSDRIFESTSSTSLREGLNFQPGLRTEVNCLNCGTSQVRMNGLDGVYSQILIDGRPIFSALNSVYGLDQIPVNMIDRVEVIRGGGSSLYGGNAIAGVINIITKQPSINQFTIDFNQSFIKGFSPENSVGITGSIINEKQDLGLNIFGMSKFRKEWDANSDGFSDIARLNVKSIGAKGYYKMSFNSLLTAEFHSLYHETRGGDLFQLPPHQTNITEEISHNTISGQVAYEQYFNYGLDKLSAYTSYQKTIRDYYYGAEQDPDGYGNTLNETWVGGLQYTKVMPQFFGEHIFTAGYEFTYDFINDIAVGNGRNIRESAVNNAIYLQDDWAINRLFSVTYGARIDKHSLLDKFVLSPRANLLVKPLENLSLRTSLSTGFRAPQVFNEDLHISMSDGERIVIKHDDNLLPEHSFSISASADYFFNFAGLPIGLSLEFFNTNLSDVFVLEDSGLDQLGYKVMIKSNGDGAKVIGGTTELEIRFSDKFNLKSGITFQRSRYNKPVEWSAGDAEDGTESQSSNIIFKSPDLYGYFILDYIIGNGFEVNLAGVYTGPMYLPHLAGYIESDRLVKTGDFFDLNTKITYRFQMVSNLDISIGAKNILNQFQKDLDVGVSRDASYIYGPATPFTLFFGIKKGI